MIFEHDLNVKSHYKESAYEKSLNYYLTIFKRFFRKKCLILCGL